jgi:hypothetical protein
MTSHLAPDLQKHLNGIVGHCVKLVHTLAFASDADGSFPESPVVEWYRNLSVTAGRPMDTMVINEEKRQEWKVVGECLLLSKLLSRNATL